MRKFFQKKTRLSAYFRVVPGGKRLTANVAVRRVNRSMPAPLEILRQVFGYDSFRGQQATVIDHVLAGGDCLVLMPTGGGKSLCYQIPAILREGTGIVVSPLIALMQDQVDALKLAGIRAGFLNSSQDLEEARRVEQRLLAGELDLLYVAPERATGDWFLGLLDRVRIALFAIDEAHCVSAWGHDFRPEYLKLALLHERFPAVPRIALTATADETTREEIFKRLNLRDARSFQAGFDRPNIRYRVELKQDPRRRLLNFLKEEHPRDAGIVYCMSRKKTEATADFLRANGFDALAYHAGMDAAVRLKNQQRFLREESVVVVATIAFGMGIDKPDVRFVVHLDPPKNMEGYYQETGRAGRDGAPAQALLLYNMADVVNLRRMIESSEGDEAFKKVQRKRLEALLGFFETVACRRASLLRYFGDPAPDHCGNCDTCLEPPAVRDGTTAAQKALSCVFRTGQIFGAGYLIDVLLGRPDERMRRKGHDRVSTFGIGAELSEREWSSVYRQLIAMGLLLVDPETGGFRLAPESRAVLRGERRIEFRQDPVVKIHGEHPVGRTRMPADAAGQDLYERLRALRGRLARERNIAPYMIFHDATLRALVQSRPRNTTELGRVNGIGEAKLRTYGQAILATIAGE